MNYLLSDIRKKLKILSLFLGVVMFSACSMDASILSSAAPILEDAINDLNRKTPDFISGEVVASDNGYKVRAVLGEISEKHTLPSGYTVEGIINE